MDGTRWALWHAFVPIGVIGACMTVMPLLAGTTALADEPSEPVALAEKTDEPEVTGTQDAPPPSEATPDDGIGSSDGQETGRLQAAAPDAEGGTAEAEETSPVDGSNQIGPGSAEPSQSPLGTNPDTDGASTDVSGLEAGDGEPDSENPPAPGNQEGKSHEPQPGSEETDGSSDESLPLPDEAQESTKPKATVTNGPSDATSPQGTEPAVEADDGEAAEPDGVTPEEASSEQGAPVVDPSAGEGVKAAAPVTPPKPKRKVIKAGTTVDVPEGTYVIRLAVGNGMVVDVRDGRHTTSSANVQTKRANGSASQLWDVIKSPQAGWYYLVAHGTNGALVIDVQGGKAANKTNVHLWERNGSAAQLWRFVAGVTGFEGDLTNLVIVSKVGSRYALDVYRGKSANGTNIEIYGRNGTKAQMVTLVRQLRQNPKAPATRGVWIHKPSGKTMLTYWYDASGKKAKGRVILPKEGAGGYYYATSNGSIAKGVATKVGNTIYLSAGNGRLATLPGGRRQGWLDSGSFGNGRRRYYLYQHGGDGYATARYGYSSDGYPHYTCAKGHVLTGKWEDGGRIYLASSAGRMVSLPAKSTRGWVDANFVKGQGRRRYYLYRSTAGGRYHGACYAKAGFSRDGGFHYTRPEGYVLRNATTNTWAGRCSANKKGIITTNFNTVSHVWDILEHISRHRKSYHETRRSYVYDGKRQYEYTIEGIDISALRIADRTLYEAQNDLLGCSQYVQTSNGMWTGNWDRDALVTKFDISYRYSRAATERLQKNLEKATRSAIKKAKSMRSERRRATYLHDWLCANASYDYSYRIYDAYTLFQKKKGVCAAYAEAYVYLCRRSGLRCQYLVGDNHAWNRVRIGNRWLYTDVTWDDCGYGHYYHLRSRAWFESHDHREL